MSYINKTVHQLITLCCSLFLIGNLLFAAEQAIVAEFKSAYASFQTLSSENKWEEALPHAEIAYQTGQKIFGENNEKALLLAKNYGYNLLQVQEHEKANTIFSTVLIAYEEEHGKKSLELIPVLFDIAQTQKKPIPSYERILSLSKTTHGESSIEYALNLSKVGNQLLIKNKKRAASQYFKEAYQILELLKNTDSAVILEFDLAKIEFSLKNYKKSIKLLKNALTSLEDNPNYKSEYELPIHKLLLKNYRFNNMDDEVITQSQTIAKLFPDEIDYLPIYKVAPVYPSVAAERGIQGTVTVQYDVDTDGYTRNHVVIESSSKLLNKSSLNAAKKFRYIPRVENGEAVVVKDVKNTFTYSLEYKRAFK